MLRLQQLSVVYPDQTKAIDNVSLCLQAGENLALLGENGAGKSSLLLAIVGILASTGTVSACGVTLSRKTLGEIRGKVGLVFQNPDDQLFMPLVYDDIAFGCRNLGWQEDRIKARVEELLAALGIGHLQNRSSLKLSGGEKRMAAIAAVLAPKPSILLFDEPSAFLDPAAKRRLAAVLRDLPHPKIIASHDLSFAAAVCKRAVLLQKGRIIAEGGAELMREECF